MCVYNKDFYMVTQMNSTFHKKKKTNQTNKNNPKNKNQPTNQTNRQTHNYWGLNGFLNLSMTSPLLKNIWLSPTFRY